MRSVTIVHINGFLKLQVIENRKRTLRSLRIKVSKSDWSESKQRVKDSCKDYQKHNTAIEAALKEANQFDKQNDVYPTTRTVLDFWQRVIDDTANHGSRIKSETIRSKFTSFLQENNRKDLPFADLTIQVINSFSRYALKTCEQDTVQHYIKFLQSICINKARKLNYYNFALNPFSQYDFKPKRKKEKPVLEPKELERMVSVHMDETDRLYKYRQLFLFSVFAQGMRISDAITIRWNQLVGGKIRFAMFKTKTKMAITINSNLQEILLYLIRTHYSEVYRKLKIDILLNEDPDASFLKVLRTMATEQGNEFVFPFLSNEDFKDVEDFSKIDEQRYVKMKHFSIIYNRNLKMLQAFYGIDTKLVSHSARHSFASLLLADKTDVWDIKQAMGHQTLAVTNNYLSDFVRYSPFLGPVIGDFKLKFGFRHYWLESYNRPIRAASFQCLDDTYGNCTFQRKPLDPDTVLIHSRAGSGKHSHI